VGIFQGWIGPLKFGAPAQAMLAGATAEEPANMVQFLALDVIAQMSQKNGFVDPAGALLRGSLREEGFVLGAIRLNATLPSSKLRSNARASIVLFSAASLGVIKPHMPLGLSLLCRAIVHRLNKILS
jgi:hypothetical protein